MRLSAAPCLSVCLPAYCGLWTADRAALLNWTLHIAACEPLIGLPYWTGHCILRLVNRWSDCLIELDTAYCGLWTADRAVLLNWTLRIFTETCLSITVCVTFLFNKTNRSTNFSKCIYVKKLYVFRAVPLPIISSFPLYIRHWYKLVQIWQGLICV